MSWVGAWLGGGVVEVHGQINLTTDDDESTDDRELGDLALTWSLALGTADVTITGTDLDADRGLVTSVLLSLFTDRRAENDDVPPSGDDRDRRGWWADEFADIEGDRVGSRLWLLARSKLTRETALNAEEFVREALAWMLEDKVVASVEVATELTTTALLISIELLRPGRDPVTFRFSHTWDHLET